MLGGRCGYCQQLKAVWMDHFRSDIHGRQVKRFALTVASRNHLTLLRWPVAAVRIELIEWVFYQLYSIAQFYLAAYNSPSPNGAESQIPALHNLYAGGVSWQPAAAQR